MKNIGAPTDPITGRLREDIKKQARSAAHAIETSRLEGHAEFMPVVESEAAQKLAVLIRTVLEDRVAVFLTEDPECRAVVSILQSFSTQKNLAAMAVAKLTPDLDHLLIKKT